MAIAGRMQIKGVAEIDRMLAQLPRAVAEDQVVSKALTKGAEVVRDQAAANLRGSGAVDTGLLAGTLTIAKSKQVLPGVVEVVLKASPKLSMVVRKGQSKATRARPSKYAYFVEYGTEHSPARPFMRPALDSKQAAAEGAIRDEMLAGVAKVARRVGLKVK